MRADLGTGPKPPRKPHELEWRERGEWDQLQKNVASLAAALREACGSSVQIRETVEKLRSQGVEFNSPQFEQLLSEGRRFHELILQLKKTLAGDKSTKANKDKPSPAVLEKTLAGDKPTKTDKDKLIRPSRAALEKGF